MLFYFFKWIIFIPNVIFIIQENKPDKQQKINKIKRKQIRHEYTGMKVSIINPFIRKLSRLFKRSKSQLVAGSSLLWSPEGAAAAVCSWERIMSEEECSYNEGLCIVLPRCTTRTNDCQWTIWDTFQSVCETTSCFSPACSCPLDFIVFFCDQDPDGERKTQGGRRTNFQRENIMSVWIFVACRY